MPTADEELIAQRLKVVARHRTDFEVVAKQAQAFVETMNEEPDLVLLDGMAYLVAGVYDLQTQYPEAEKTMILTFLLAAALGELTVAVRMLTEGLHRPAEEIVKELVEQVMRVE